MRTDLFQVYFNAEGQDGGNGDNSTPENKEEKKFTQTDVDKIVSGRLAKEKEKYADYDALKTKASEFDTIKNQMTELTTKAQLSDDTLNEVLNDLVNSIDEEKKSLIPEQLSVVDKIKYINKNRNNFVKTVTPQTPPPENIPKGEGGLYGGKYKTLQEWSEKDPIGYLKFRKSQ